MKTCFKCKSEKPSDEFYRHPRMADGRLGKCKDCTKRDVLNHRAANLEKVREYDRARSMLPHRARLRARVTKEWGAKHPGRRAAHYAAGRKHRKAPEACQMCGLAKRLERHHPDYTLPLFITWLCKPCHYIADKARREKEQGNT